MTPLAQMILNDSCKPTRNRSWQRNDAGVDVPKELSSAHAFELSSVVEMVQPLGVKMLQLEEGRVVGLSEQRFAFLPAPLTWLEWKPVGDHLDERYGFLLDDIGEVPGIGHAALCTMCAGTPTYIGAIAEFVLPLSGAAELGKMKVPKVLLAGALTPGSALNHSADLYPALAIINTPRVIGRRQHTPHAGLQKKLAPSRGLVGKFPLRAWTEIVLEVTPPMIDEGDPEANFTGRKALHFCRAHLRVQNGRLVLVSAHWRGDPALGIVQSRYRLTPPLQRQAAH